MTTLRRLFCLASMVSIGVLAFSKANITTADTLEGEIEIWPGVGPGSDTLSIEQNIIVRSVTGTCDRNWAVDNITVPTITPVIPDNPNGSAVIICPGGAYLYVVYDVEGLNIGQWLNTIGITAFVLKYRVPSDQHIDKRYVALQDAQRALRYVKAHSEEWDLDTNKIGIMGASAGGHAASSLSTLYNKKVYKPRDAIDSISAQPNFALLLYPVISMESSITHTVTRNNLIGSSPTQALVDTFSAEKNVTPVTPPTFMARAADDNGVHADNCNRYYQALQDSGVISELHIFDNGGHGVGICKAVGSDFENWPDYCTNWLYSIGMTEDTVEIVEVSGLNDLSFYKPTMRVVPNPVTLKSQLTYSVSFPAPIKISLIDLIGRQKDVLVQEYKQAGDYNLALHKYINQNLSGVYLLKLTDGRNTITEKLIF